MGIITATLIIAFLTGLIPTIIDYVMYCFCFFLYRIACLMIIILDLVQSVFRRLAGLEPIWSSVTSNSNATEKSGDILLTLLTNDVIINVFTAVLFTSIFVLLIATIVQVIRVEYTTQGAGNSKGKIIGSAVKGLAYMLTAPVAVVLGIMVLNALLMAFDAATSYGASTISGTIFRSAAIDANVLASGETEPYFFDGKFSLLGGESVKISVDYIDNHKDGIIKYVEPETGDTNVSYDMANQIDALFAGGLTNNSNVSYTRSSTNSQSTTNNSVQTTLNGGGNPFNVGVDVGETFDISNPWKVTYFYNLGDINYFILYLGLGLALTTMVNTLLGMIMRLYQCAILFMLAPAPAAMMPLDNGKMMGTWRTSFTKEALSAYGPVLGLNLFFVVMGALQDIYIFDPNANNYFERQFNYSANMFMQMLFILVGLMSIKKVIGLIASTLGSNDASAAGGEASGKIGGAIGKGVAIAATGGIASGLSLYNKVSQLFDNNKDDDKIKNANQATNNLNNFTDKFKDENGNFNESNIESEADKKEFESLKTAKNDADKDISHLSDKDISKRTKKIARKERNTQTQIAAKNKFKDSIKGMAQGSAFVSGINTLTGGVVPMFGGKGLGLEEDVQKAMGKDNYKLSQGNTLSDIGGSIAGKFGYNTDKGASNRRLSRTKERNSVISAGQNVLEDRDNQRMFEQQYLIKNITSAENQVNNASTLALENENDNNALLNTLKDIYNYMKDGNFDFAEDLYNGEFNNTRQKMFDQNTGDYQLNDVYANNLKGLNLDDIGRFAYDTSEEDFMNSMKDHLSDTSFKDSNTQRLVDNDQKLALSELKVAKAEFEKGNVDSANQKLQDIKVKFGDKLNISTQSIEGIKQAIRDTNKKTADDKAQKASTDKMIGLLEDIKKNTKGKK